MENKPKEIMELEFKYGYRINRIENDFDLFLISDDISYSINESGEITQLNLSRIPIGKIEIIGDMVNLVSLRLSRCKIEKIEGLYKLSKLKYLDFSDNLLSTTDGLNNLYSLENID